jgi:hypothetical protein
MLKFPLPAACALLAAAGLAVPAHADPPIYPPSYGSTAVYLFNVTLTFVG